MKKPILNEDGRDGWRPRELKKIKSQAASKKPCQFFVWPINWTVRPDSEHVGRLAIDCSAAKEPAKANPEFSRAVGGGYRRWSTSTPAKTTELPRQGANE
jgi:hypothetical protein